MGWSWLWIEIDGNLEETEIVIKTPTLTGWNCRLATAFARVKGLRLTLQGDRWILFRPVRNSLQTEGARFYAHNQKEAYEVRLKPYELSLSCLAILTEFPSQRSQNIRRFTSVDKSFSGTATVSFYQTHKEVHVHGITNPPKENLRNMR